MNPRLPRRPDHRGFRTLGGLVVPVLLGVVALGIGFVLRDMALDDPFVTYRYAENLAAGHGFVYNEGERILSTTAPLYALLLAAGRLVTSDLPALSNWIGILSLWGGACLIYRICVRFGQLAAGIVAGLLYATFPLLWLSLGFEVPFYLLLALGGFYCSFSGKLALAALLMAAATLTRADGVIPAGVMFLGQWLEAKGQRPMVKGLLIYLLALAPALIALTVYFGSPVPVTLAAKNAQTTLGVTGFYAGTTFVQGAVIRRDGLLRRHNLRAGCGDSGARLVFADAAVHSARAGSARWAGGGDSAGAVGAGFRRVGCVVRHWLSRSARGPVPLVLRAACPCGSDSRRAGHCGRRASF